MASAVAEDSGVCYRARFLEKRVCPANPMEDLLAGDGRQERRLLPPLVSLDGRGRVPLRNKLKPRETGQSREGFAISDRLTFAGVDVARASSGLQGHCHKIFQPE